jgi:hypothetical protein
MPSLWTVAPALVTGDCALFRSRTSKKTSRRSSEGRRNRTALAITLMSCAGVSRFRAGHKVQYETEGFGRVVFGRHSPRHPPECDRLTRRQHRFFNCPPRHTSEHRTFTYLPDFGDRSLRLQLSVVSGQLSVAPPRMTVGNLAKSEWRKANSGHLRCGGPYAG